MKERNDNYSLPFPKRLRQLMDEAGVNQQELADFVGVKRQTVAQWKDGKSTPDIYFFRRIAAFFRVPYEYLYGDTESRVAENLDLAERFGLSDKAIANLTAVAEYAGEQEKDEYISLRQVLSYILEDEWLVPMLRDVQDAAFCWKISNEDNRDTVHDQDKREAQAAELLKSSGKVIMDAGVLSEFYVNKVSHALYETIGAIPMEHLHKTMGPGSQHVLSEKGLAEVFGNGNGSQEG
ncbi:helix-turn-helix transcriptional regulator [Ruminococcaceae bacterium OttesenSCG-928-L11]|nr:helix-turn-helix transcriptional regulator [Ruminococcaceae bacterium OttesenSCG-928-L11]